MSVRDIMNFKFEYEQKEIQFNIVHRKRKTICIKIEENQEVTVIAPLRISKDYILKFVKDKANWIIQKQEEIKQRSSNKIEREILEGSTFMYLGEEYPLHLIFDKDTKNISVEFIKEFDHELNKSIIINKKVNLTNNFSQMSLNGKICIIHTNTIDTEKIKIALEKWYRQETFKIVRKRIDYYSNNFKDKVTDIRVKEQKRRWASCTGKNAILFNWRCSMARADVLDYIVIHEMCHMDHRNHSKYFWNRVQEIMPDYKQKHEWLKINGMNLTI